MKLRIKVQDLVNSVSHNNRCQAKKCRSVPRYVCNPILYSLSVYVVAFISALARLLVYNDTLEIFAVLTNFAFVLPVFVIADPTDYIFPAISVLLIFEAFGSMAHHARNCTNPNYRVIDLEPIYLTYIYFVAWGLWGCFCDRTKIVRITIRVISGAGLASAMLWYEWFTHNQEWIVATFAGISGGLLAFSVWKRKTATIKVALLSAGIILLLYGCASYVRARKIGPTHSEEILHGMWHIFNAQAQYILVSSFVFVESEKYVGFFEWAISAFLPICITILASFNVVETWQILILSAFGCSALFVILAK